MSAVDPSPFHEGELAVQERVGVRDHIAPFAGRAIRGAMPAQHRVFFEALPFLVVAARDAERRPWASVLVGDAGFVHSPEPDRLALRSEVSDGDALHGAFVPGAAIGLLGIEFDTRRRNRVNGTVVDARAGGIGVRVDQSFGNCPQYISKRKWYRHRNDIAVAGGDPPYRSDVLDDVARRWIESADTAFVASGVDERTASGAAAGMDVSHRGGSAGFIDVLSPTRLIVPDYAGNNFFNTLGNIASEPAIGLLFVDFENGHLLQISGRATIDWDPESASRHPGAQRLLVVDVDAVVRSMNVLPLRWTPAEDATRELVVAARTVESCDVVSFELVSRDGGALIPFRAGQHLPVEISTGDGRTLARSYSLTNDERDDRYRIAIKRLPGGLVSTLLHERLKVGDALLGGGPSGEFGLPDDDRPVVLTSAGIGITPMVSLLHAAVREGRAVDFVHAARDGEHHPFVDEIRAVATTARNVRLHIAYSRPGTGDRLGIDHDAKGRLDPHDPAMLPTPPSAHHFVCGPSGFVAAIVGALESRGVASERVRIETF